MSTLRESLTGATNAYDQLGAQLDARKHEFSMLLGKQIPVERFIRVIKNAVLGAPDLLNADRKSLITACLRCASDGLIPDGREAALIVYNVNKKGPGGVWDKIKSVQYQPMVAGLIKKMYESGDVTYVDAAAVYSADSFSFERGEAPKLVHVPSASDAPGSIVASYCVIKLASGEIKREVMFARDIAKVRAVSKASDGPGWSDWEDQFAIKSVIKRAYKQLPHATEIESVIQADNEAAFEQAPGRVHTAVVGDALAIEDAPSERLPETVAQAPEREPARRRRSGAEAEDVGEQPSPGARLTTAAREPASGGDSMKVTFAKLADAINKAKDVDVLDAHADLIASLPEDQQNDARILVGRRRAELTPG